MIPYSFVSPRLVRRTPLRHDLIVLYVDHADRRPREVQAYADVLLMDALRSYFHLQDNVILPLSSAPLLARYNRRLAVGTGREPFVIVPQNRATRNQSATWYNRTEQLQQEEGVDVVDADRNTQQRSTRRVGNIVEENGDNEAEEEDDVDDEEEPYEEDEEEDSLNNGENETDNSENATASEETNHSREPLRCRTPNFEADFSQSQHRFYTTYEQLERETYRMIVGEDAAPNDDSVTMRGRITYELHRTNGFCLTTVVCVTADVRVRGSEDTSETGDPYAVIFRNRSDDRRVSVMTGVHCQRPLREDGIPSYHSRYVRDEASQTSNERNHDHPESDSVSHGPINSADWPNVTNIRVITPFAHASFYSPVDIAETHEVLRLVLKRVESMGIVPTRDARNAEAVYSTSYRHAALLSRTGLLVNRSLRTRALTAPRFPRQVSVGCRILSFESWPPSIQQTPDSLVDAGFFYRNRNDTVRCFHCGVRINSWMQNVSPEARHAIVSPRCHYMLSSRGISFVVVQRMIEAVRRLSNIRQIRGLGHNPDDELELSHRHSLPIRIMDQNRAVEEDRYSAALRFDSFESDGAVTARENATPAVDAVSQVDAANENANSNNGREENEATGKTETYSEEREERTTYTRTSEGQDFLAVSRTPVCRVCLVAPIQIIFFPCKHAPSCLTCSNRLTVCPICRSTVHNTSRVYFG